MTDFELKAGPQLANLDDCIGQVSAWLSANHPNTRPKTPEALMRDAAHSVYAMQNGHTIGHIGLMPQAERFSIEFGGGREGGWDLPVPHFVIESLVIKPGQEGAGVGTALLAEAMGQVTAQLTADANYALVSAMACQASCGLFGKFGFDTFWGSTKNRMLETVAPYTAMDLGIASSYGKSIVSKLIKA